MTKVMFSTLFCFLTFLQFSKSSPITSVHQPSSLSSQRMPMDLCPDFVPGTRKVSKASKCLPHQEMALQGLPYGHLPTAADASADPCHWHFQCLTDATRTSTTTSGQKNAFWWEAVLKTPGKNGPRICQTSQGQGRCVPLKKHEIVVRYPRNSSEKACFYWRKVKTSYYCKVDGV